MIGAGIKAKITCVDPAKLGRSFAGREFDQAFLESLPPGVDACGENGEFHTFVYDSPVFSSPIATRNGTIVERDGFIFADVLPGRPVGGFKSPTPKSNAGLCTTCLNAAVVASDRESVFSRCLLSNMSSKFPRVITCSGRQIADSKSF